MKRRLLVALTIGLVLLATACNQPNDTKIGNTAPTVTPANTSSSKVLDVKPADATSPKPTTQQPVDTTNWKPSTFEGVNGLIGVSITVDQKKATPSKLTLSFSNDTSKQYLYGESYTLERKINGHLYTVPVAFQGNYVFTDIAYFLPPNGTCEMKVDWNWLYGELGAGEYRIVKDILEVRRPGDYTSSYLAAEFRLR